MIQCNFIENEGKSTDHSLFFMSVSTILHGIVDAVSQQFCPRLQLLAIPMAYVPFSCVIFRPSFVGP